MRRESACADPRSARVRLVLVWLAVTSCGGDAAPVYAWHGTRWAAADWPEPSCFAYSPVRHAYACIGWAATGDGEARRGAVDLVGARSRERHVVWTDGARPPVALDARLRSLGFRPGRIARVELSADRWQRAGTVAVRYQWHLHEGDASFEYSASLWLRCRDGREREIALDDAELEQGERAVLFAAEGAGVLALSIQGADGGEGFEERTLDTTIIEPAAICGVSRQ